MAHMPNIDPIELEIFTNIFTSITEEMGSVFRRASGASNLQERCDYSCAVLDKNCRIIAMDAYLPLHLGAMSLSVNEAVNSLRLAPGDVAVLNDPFGGGTHPHGMTMVSALFPGNQKSPDYYVAVRTHYRDTGGLPPVSVPLNTETLQEGIIVPPIKLYADGNLNRTLLQMILYNSSIPRKAEADLAVQLEALKIGEKRVSGMVSENGLDMVGIYSAALLNRAENLLKKAIASIPDGTYSAEDFLDDDGIDPSQKSKPLPLKVKLTVKESILTVDFSGSAPQTAGSMNAVISVTTSVVHYILNCLRPLGESLNCSLPQSLKIIAPEGSALNALFPAATTAGYMETSQRIADVILKAMAGPLPDLIPAASGGTNNTVAILGINPVTGRPFSYHETIGSGTGGGPGGGGAAGKRIHMTNSRNTSIEILENAYPLRIGEYSLRKKSGGGGTSPGGNGIIRSYEAVAPDTQVKIISERRKQSPYGLKGGRVGKKGTETLIPHKGAKRKLRGKDSVILNPGDRVVIETPGGGGWGKSR